MYMNECVYAGEERSRTYSGDLDELVHVVVAASELPDLGLALRHQRPQPLLVPRLDCHMQNFIRKELLIPIHIPCRSNGCF